jgi:hypothetical protein
VAVPQHALWSGVVTVAAGLAIASPLGTAGANPLARRTADLLEYLALAAVAPSACWVADLFALVRGASLT